MKPFYKILENELTRIDAIGTTKRHERIIEKFTKDEPPRAYIDGKPRSIFNSNDYLGLRFHPSLHKGEEVASKKFGTGPGAVRFISGTLAVHRELERALATFHSRDDAMVFSSAFASNVGVLPSLLRGQSKDSLVSGDSMVISDELNHRSIIEGIRSASIDSEHKAIFKHMDSEVLRRVLNEQKNKFKRVIVVTDGVFSMLGEYQDLSALRAVINECESWFEEGIFLLVDDAHGVGCFGETGRGVEEVCKTKSDILVGTLGKAFGADGGYIVGDQIMIDYLRESAATYIYSNSISPGTAGAALAAVELMNKATGKKLLKKLRENIDLFKKLMKDAGFIFAVDSIHPIQPLLIGDTAKTKYLVNTLFDAGYLVTNINYPVVPKGRDEIRIQISASHTKEDLKDFVKTLEKIEKK